MYEMNERDKREVRALILILPIISIGMFIIPFVRARIIMKLPIWDGVIAGVAGSILFPVGVLVAYFAMRAARRRRGE